MNQQRLKDVAIKYTMKKATGWGGGNVAEKSAFLVRKKFSF